MIKLCIKISGLFHRKDPLLLLHVGIRKLNELRSESMNKVVLMNQCIGRTSDLY